MRDALKSGIESSVTGARRDILCVCVDYPKMVLRSRKRSVVLSQREVWLRGCLRGVVGRAVRAGAWLFRDGDGRTGVPEGIDMEVYIAIVGRGGKETLQSFQWKKGG